nr:hypothetical protein [uncultured Pseudomonas sp.]
MTGSARWLALFGLIAASPAWAGLGKDYDRAIVYVERESYAKAIPLLESVISEVPASLPRIRLYGMRFAPYTPHYYLGLAHYRLGHCEQALSSWAREARFKVLAGKNADNLASAKADCQAKLVQAGKTLPLLEERISDAQAVGDAALAEVVEAFFNGAYEQVAHFDPATLATPASRAQAWIYRAASQYTLYVLGGESADESLADVQESLASASSADPDIAVERSGFSPKFLKLMDQEVGR